ncbi:hypothetical protein HU200_052106 [Digitaria exilis]|uniref:RNase H type-1 domain-containing protein n=1 Tax=Digitaria exilis TaxID=1010633 RepID=A0A835E9Y2_9POAL|nr:hypothetical protein HU200_052106 [Digitaria exilis]
MVHYAASTEEVELIACREGVKLAAEWVPRLAILEFVFSHVKREQNRVAHELAQIARRLSHCAVWRNRAPVCVEQLVAHDCNFPVQ